jgi:general stress protein 26
MIRNPERTMGNLIDKQGAAYIGSVDADGFPNVKAMLAPRARDGIETFYFTTNTSSVRTGQYMCNNKACIYFCDKRFFRGVMLTGFSRMPIQKRCFGARAIPCIIPAT